MTVLDLTALAEQCIGFIEKQDGAAVFGGIEHLAQVFLRFADVFADHGREIYPDRLSLSSRAITSAAMVLPVPLSPENRALIPSPRFIRLRNPHSS